MARSEDAECSEEHRRYEAESERRISEMAKQREFLHKLVTERELRETPTGTPTLSNSPDDIEAYRTTFERMMKAYEVDTARWAYKLAPQPTGQAYAVLSPDEAQSYDVVKASRYSINA